MNNSKFVVDQVSLSREEAVDFKPLLRQRETELITIIEALEHISGSEYWIVLYEKVFNKDLSSLQTRLESEKNPTEIYRLQGEIKRAKTLDLAKKLQAYRSDLQNVRNQINAGN